MAEETQFFTNKEEIEQFFDAVISAEIEKRIKKKISMEEYRQELKKVKEEEFEWITKYPRPYIYVPNLSHEEFAWYRLMFDKLKMKKEIDYAVWYQDEKFILYIKESSKGFDVAKSVFYILQIYDIANQAKIEVFFKLSERETVDDEDIENALLKNMVQASENIEEMKKDMVRQTLGKKIPYDVKEIDYIKSKSLEDTYREILRMKNYLRLKKWVDRYAIKIVS